MNEDWVKQNLTPHINGSNLVLSYKTDGTINDYVNIVDFVNLFKDVPEPTYQILAEADGEKGYAPYFEKWRSEGLI